MTTPISPPPGQGPIDPRGAFYPPPPDQPGSGPGSPPGFAARPPAGPPGSWQPPMMPPPPPPWMAPQRPRRRWGDVFLMLFAIAWTLVFAASLLLNIVLGGVAASQANLKVAGVRETTVISGDAQQKVVIIPVVNEMILQAQADQLDKMFDAVEKDSSVKAVVLRIDSPGGGVTPSDEMYHRIVDFKLRKSSVPVVVSMGSLAASGGYYTACAGDYLFAEPTTITGSIGVLMPQYNAAKLADKWGIEDDSIHSTGAPYKTAGSWLRPPTTQETNYLLGLIDSDFTQFKSVVVASRKGKLTEPITDIANGKAYTESEALRLGLIDAEGYLGDAAAYAARTAGLSRMTLVRYDPQPTLLELFGGSSSAAHLPPASAGSGVQINGVQVNGETLDSLLTPRLLYMWRGE